jgi:hypothetical protein
VFPVLFNFRFGSIYMTSQEWRKSNNALAMLDSLYPVRGLDSVEPQSRASRLYLLACARKNRSQLPSVCHIISLAAEDLFYPPKLNRAQRDKLYPYAEALVHCRGDADEVNIIGRALVDLGFIIPDEAWATQDIPPEVWSGPAYLSYAPFSNTTPNYQRIPDNLHSAELVREHFGDPFAIQPPFRNEWRSANVMRLAEYVDSNGDYSVLPILADALQEEGCTREDILEHLRCRGPHHRGCWALEKTLGRGD